MKQETSKLLLVFSFGFLLAYTLLSNSGNKKNGVSKDVLTFTKSDTVYVPKPYPVVITKEKIVNKPYKVLELDTVYIVSSINSYRDTVEMEKNYSIIYDAEVLGNLNSISLTSIDNRPQKVIKETTTVTKYPSGLYIGATTDLSLNSSIGLTYVKGKNMIGGSVKLNNQEFNNITKYNLSYHRKLF